jgi:capsular polysaccharide transport system permease protein
MTTKPKVKKFRVRGGASLGSDNTAPQEDARMVAGGDPAAAQANVASPTQVASESSLDDIRKEGLTGRQLRMARRVAQKNGFAVTSDFDAVRQLRAAGIDPFQRNTILELVTPEGAAPAAGAAPAGPDGGDAKKALGRIQLPQTVPQGNTLPSPHLANAADNRANELMQIQRDLGRRRRRKTFLLFTRLAAFVMLPTFAVGWYFYFMATPMFATKSEFVIQQAEATGSAAGGLGGLFQGTGMATQQDSTTVQSYLASRAAMLRLDEDHGFKAHFSADNIDSIQRLDADATNEAAFGVYENKIKISYDPTEGILRMEVIAADPETSQEFSEALISYAEEQVDQLTQRLREDQMAGARQSYEASEVRRAEALERWLTLQQETGTVDPLGITAASTAQISALEQQRQQLQLTLQERLGVRRPNAAQVDALRNQIANIDGLITDIRQELTAATGTGSSVASVNTELRLAEENYTFQTILVQQALTQMEAAQIAANRQVRYLSLGVEPVAPDEATYPRAFENTALAFLIFCGIYLMISLTASILREQVTS